MNGIECGQRPIGGSVLPVALLFLLLLTFMTVSSMDALVLEERMAGNLHDQQRMYELAVAVARKVRSQLDNELFHPQGSQDGSTGLWTPGGLWGGDAVWAGGAIWDTQWWAAHGQTMSVPGGPDELPGYVVEFLGTTGDGASGTLSAIYRITIRVSGYGERSTLYLQTHHVVRQT